MTAKKQCLLTSTNISESADTTIDTAKLLTFLRSNVVEFQPDASDADAEVEPKLVLYQMLAGFVNAPFLMTFGTKKYVLRRDKRFPMENPSDRGLNCTSTLRKTYEMMDIVSKGATDIPCPKMIVFCEDKSIMGAEFYVMEFIEGRMFKNIADTDTDSPDSPMAEEDKLEIYAEIGRVLSLIHAFPWQKNAQLLECFQKYNGPKLRFTVHNFFKLSLQKFKRFIAYLEDANPETSVPNINRNDSFINVIKFYNLMNGLMQAKHDAMYGRNGSTMNQNEMEQKMDGNTNANANANINDANAIEIEIETETETENESESFLIHGDFHWENLIWHPTQNRIIAVVDWEGANIGSPVLELGYNTMCWAVWIFMKLYHEKQVKHFVGNVVKTEFQKHAQRRLKIRESYARALQVNHPRCYELNAAAVLDDQQARFYEALYIYRSIAWISVMHFENSVHAKKVIQAFPAVLTEFMGQIGLCLLNEVILQPNNNDEPQNANAN